MSKREMMGGTVVMGRELQFDWINSTVEGEKS